MAIQKKLIHFKKLESFKEQLDSSNILETSIVFIQDAKLIWTHGQFYASTEEVQTQISEIITKIEDNDLVIAASLTDLEDRKANKSDLEELTGLDIKVSDSYTTISYPEQDDPNVVFSPISAEDSLESALGKIEDTISNLIQAVLDNEMVTASSLTDLEERKLDKDSVTGDIVKLSDSFEITEYPELTNEEIVFTPLASQDTLDSAANKLEENFVTLLNETLKNEISIAAALTDLDETKLDKEGITADIIGLSSDFETKTYPEIGDEDVVFDPIAETDTLETATSKLEGNLITLVQETIDNEKVIAAALTDLENSIQSTEEEITTSYQEADNEIRGDLSALEDIVIELDEVTAAALTDLEDRKVDKTAVTGDLVTLSKNYVTSEYPEDTGGVEFNSVEASETLDSAINKLESNFVTLLNETLENEEVIASAYTELNDKKLELADLVYEYSESPTETLETLGNNPVYRKFFTLEYTTPGTETTWELSCTTDISTVIVLGLECILKQVLGEEGTISFDYRDQYLFGDNANILKYYFKHSTGSLIIKFSSNTTTVLTGSIKFSCSGSIITGDSSNVTASEVIDGGLSI